MFFFIYTFVTIFFLDPILIGDDFEDSDHSFEDGADDYTEILDHLSKQWLDIELTHQVSKVATDQFWNCAKKWFHPMFLAKNREHETRKTPSFTHKRRKMYTEYVPQIHMEMGYENKTTGEVTIVKDTKTPKSRFPPNLYTKLWEHAHVKVIFFNIELYFCYY